MNAVLVETDPRPAAPAPSASREPRRWLKNRTLRDLLLLTIPVAFGLWSLRAELIVVPYPNDSGMHEQMVRWATAMIEMGRSPLTGWYSYLQLGAAHFAHYQSLPHILTAFVGQLTGPEVAFRLALYLLLSLWPVAVYATARLFSLERPAVMVAAFASPLVVSVTGLGYEWTSYVWGGPGVWSQLWGMMLVGPATALSWRAVRGKGSLAVAAGLVALTVAMHFQTGYSVLISLGIFVIAAPSQFWRRLARAAAVAAGSLVAAAWVVFPLIRDNNWINRTVADARVDHDSYGARKVLGWLVTGELFDGYRWPVLTLVGAAGIAACVRRFRRDEPARVVLGLFVLMLLLFCGRPTLGPLLELLPGSDDVFLTRFISGVHLAGILIIGVGGSWMLAGARKVAARLNPRERLLAVPLAVLLILAALVVAVGERTFFMLRDADWLYRQAEVEADKGAEMNGLIAIAKQLGGGRIYSGSRVGWGDDYEIGLISGPDRLANQDTDSIGLVLRTGALSSDIETVFDEANPAHYELLNVRYLLYPDYRKPRVPASFVARRGDSILWRVPTSGYLKVIDTSGSIEADNGSVLAANRRFLGSDLIELGIHPAVRFPGVAIGPSTLDEVGDQQGPAGSVIEQHEDTLIGTYGGTVRMERHGVVMLKSSFDGGWSATVDGASRPVFMVAPSFPAIEVGPGEHEVRFEYRSSTNYPLLFLIGLVAIAALAAVDRRRAGARPRSGRSVRRSAR